MKAEVRKKISSINNKALYKVYKNNKRYNTNSISGNHRCLANTSRSDDNSIVRRWRNNKKGTRRSRLNE